MFASLLRQSIVDSSRSNRMFQVKKICYCCQITGCRFDNVGFWLSMKFIFQYLEKLLQNNRFTGPMAHNAMPPADKNKDNQSFKVCHP
ncbi:hypothetical protein L1987_78075 [Smallanthus sonchifolius]|uniref:Uncharacterized protein n=1 Tax=Smallanthus sonchifolius TaxID=185202 RepID=A0ACB8ZBE0_9ASTR|nr:hypothetical protein L1987_78075 [Smallanthus sonchifolius]